MLSKERVSAIGGLLRKIHVVSKWKSDNFCEANKLLAKGCFNFVVIRNYKISQIMEVIGNYTVFFTLGPLFWLTGYIKNLIKYTKISPIIIVCYEVKNYLPGCLQEIQSLK